MSPKFGKDSLYAFCGCHKVVLHCSTAVEDDCADVDFVSPRKIKDREKAVIAPHEFWGMGNSPSSLWAEDHIGNWDLQMEPCTLLWMLWSIIYSKFLFGADNLIQHRHTCIESVGFCFMFFSPLCGAFPPYPKTFPTGFQLYSLNPQIIPGTCAQPLSKMTFYMVVCPVAISWWLVGNCFHSIRWSEWCLFGTFSIVHGLGLPDLPAIYLLLGLHSCSWSRLRSMSMYWIEIWFWKGMSKDILSLFFFCWKLILLSGLKHWRQFLIAKWDMQMTGFPFWPACSLSFPMSFLFWQNS